MSAFGNCEEYKVDISLLKKFAMNARSELMAESDEKTAYFGFMRLCALHMAEPSFAAAESDHVKWPEVSEPTVVSGAGSASAPDTARSTQHTGAPTADPARPTAPERTVRPTTAVTTPTTASTTAEVTAPTTIPIENSLPEEFSGGEA